MPHPHNPFLTLLQVASSRKHRLLLKQTELWLGSSRERAGRGPGQTLQPPQRSPGDRRGPGGSQSALCRRLMSAQRSEPAEHLRWQGATQRRLG